jgi:hypothetical protein
MPPDNSQLKTPKAKRPEKRWGAYRECLRTYF